MQPTFRLGDEHLDRFFDGLGTRTHGNEDKFGIRCAGIIEQMVFTARDFADFLHVALATSGTRS